MSEARLDPEYASSELSILAQHKERQAAQWRRLRTSKTLPDGSVVFDCVCGQTIARTRMVDGHNRFEIRLRGGQDKLGIHDEEELKVQNTGGKCPKQSCQKRNGFTTHEIAQALGFKSYGELLRRDGICLVRNDPKLIHNYFVVNYIIRTDGKLVGLDRDYDVSWFMIQDGIIHMTDPFADE